VRPSDDRLNRSLKPDVRGDNHAAVDDQHQGAAPSTLPVNWAVPRSGMGIERGLLHGRSWTDPAC
jgi:hypothetical protein